MDSLDIKKIVIVSFNYEGICSTETAKALRNIIRVQVSTGSQIYLDMRKVRSITRSYIGELFIELQNEYGQEWIDKNVKIRARKDILEDIRKELMG